jgi:hypothetical protein
LTFQSNWFSAFPWLHFSSEQQAVVCFVCAKTNSLGLLSLVSKSEPTFISKGYRNGKKAMEKFSSHEKTSTHGHAVSQLQQIKIESVVGRLSKLHEKQQQAAGTALIVMFSSVRYLARLSLPLRVHKSDNGN